ncbi:MAG: flavodoxin reductase [Bacteroidetes bacterium]|nr:flavodoxin reductase [Bacteroidota bacterium]
MEEHIVKIKVIEHATHDVLRIVLEKPEGYNFNPGQATEISINKKGWEKERRPFTFTCLPSENYLEFHTKTYPERKSVTNELLSLKAGDQLILHDVWGTIGYKGEGVFIAGGAGVTPFIAIFRYLKSKNELGNSKLIFSNKKREDIILKKEFEKILGENFINILSEEDTNDYPHGHITEDFLKQNIGTVDQKFYVCGPPPMMDAVEGYLKNLGIKKEDIVKEEF